MKLSKTIPFAVLSMAVVALTGCKNEFDGYEFYKLIEEVPATCTMGGMKAHYESKPNDKGDTIYLNEDKKKVDLEELIIPATGHNMTYHPEQYATCEEEGVIAHYHCSNCNLDYEDETGKTLIDDLHKSTKGHVMDHVWTPTPGSETTHCHKCAREGCNYYEDEESCVFDRYVIKDEYAVEDEPGTYYKSCACGRKGTEKFTPAFTPTIDVDEKGWQEKAKNFSDLEDYDPSNDPITLRDLGEIGFKTSEYFEIPNQSLGSHIFGKYDSYDSNGIDLEFDFKFDAVSGSYSNIYFGNNRDESGLQIRFLTDRHNKYVQGYFYKDPKFGGDLIKGDGTPFYTDTTGDSVFYVKASEEIGAERKIEIKLEPVTSPTVENYDMYKISIFVNGLKFKKDAEQDPTIDDLCVGFPKGYFRNENEEPIHNWVRFSYHPENGSKAYIKDAPSSPRLVLMDDEGECIGASKSGQTRVSMPPLSKVNHKFVGWFDTQGNRVTSDTLIDSRIVASPYFIEASSLPAYTNVTLSDLDLLSSGFKDFTTNNEIANGFEEGFRRIPVTAKTTNVKVAFVAKFKFASSRGGKVVDDYFQFGLPYDYKDNQTRFVFRINADSGVTSLRGYVGGPATSLGAHGTEGTFFNDDKFVMTEGVSYLIAMSYEESQHGAGLDYTIEITNLATNTYRGFTFPGVKFINSDDFSFANPYRNYFSVIRSRADAVLTMSNAW